MARHTSKNPAHGSQDRYATGCRRDACRAWRADQTIRDREKRRARRAKLGHAITVKNPSHGTERCYEAGCRCEPCHAAYNRRKARTRKWQKTTYGATHVRQQAAHWRAANSDRVRANAAIWRAKNRERTRAYQAAWRAANADKVRAARIRHRAQQLQTPEQTRLARNAAYQRAWRKANPEKSRAIAAKSRRLNADRVRAYKANYRAEHRAGIRAYATRWRAAHRPATRAPLATAWPFVHVVSDLDPITATVNAAVPRHLPEHIRQDVCQELAIELLTTGQLTPEAIRAAIAATRRRYPLLSGYHLSLNARKPGHRDGQDWINQLPDPAALAAFTELERSHA